MINAAIFLVYEELLPHYEWKTNHSTLAVVNTLKNLHVYLVTAQITLSFSLSAASQSPSLLNNITPRHFFSFIRVELRVVQDSTSLSYKIKHINLQERFK